MSNAKRNISFYSKTSSSNPPSTFKISHLTCVHFGGATPSNISSTKAASVRTILTNLWKRSRTQLNCPNKRGSESGWTRLCLSASEREKRDSADRLCVLQRAGRDWKPNGERARPLRHPPPGSLWRQQQVQSSVENVRISLQVNLQAD